MILFPKTSQNFIACGRTDSKNHKIFPKISDVISPLPPPPPTKFFHKRSITSADNIGFDNLAISKYKFLESKYFRYSLI